MRSWRMNVLRLLLLHAIMMIVSVRAREAETESVSVAFSDFSTTTDLMLVLDAVVDEHSNRIDLTPETHATTSKAIRGKALYKRPIRMTGSSSFNTNFTFAMKPQFPAVSGAGDGLAFVIVANPFFEGDANGGFGIFKGGSSSRSTFAVEFDTFMNPNFKDADSNHVGVDMNRAVSLFSANASDAGISLNDGAPVTAWIDYSAMAKLVEVRIGRAGSDRPSIPLIADALDLSGEMQEQMWIGFSAATDMGSFQSHSIASWSFLVDFSTAGPAAFPTSSTPDFIAHTWRSTGFYAIAAIGGAFVILLLLVIACCTRCCVYPRSTAASSPSPSSSSSRLAFARRACCCCCCGRRRVCCRCCADPIVSDVPEQSTKTWQATLLELTRMFQEDVSNEVTTNSPLQPSPPPPVPSAASDPGGMKENQQHQDENGKGKEKEKEKEKEEEQEKKGCLPFTIQEPPQPGCLSTLLFGDDDSSDDDEGRDASSAIGERNSVIMYDNRAFDLTDRLEQACGFSSSDPAINCLLRSNEETPPQPLAKESALIDAFSSSCSAPPATTSTTTPDAAAPKRYDITPEEQMAMGWGHFSP